MIKKERYFLGTGGVFLAHKERAKYGTANSTSSEKGTDGKKNNTSEYNHKYYTENTEKWKDNDKKKNSKTSKSDDDDLFYSKDGRANFGHKDYDPNDPDFKRTDGEAIAGTNLKMFKSISGQIIILGNGIKFSFPPGTKISSAVQKKIAEAEKASGGDKERYVAKMLNAVTGFADKQGLDLGDKKKASTSKKTEEKKTEEKKTEKKETDEWSKTIKKINSGASSYDYEREKKKTVKHSDFGFDLGSVLVKDLYS